VIDWVEVGGPPVKEPTRKGFGSTIIQHSVSYDLGGTAEINFDPKGFRARFVIPAKHVVVPDEKDRAAIARPRRPVATASTDFDPNLIAGKSVLLIEDSLIIALDAEDALRRLGAKSVATEATVPGAIAAIELEKPDLAVLDINLGDTTSFTIADRLADLNVPFLFATGYGEQARLPDRLLDRPVLQKPYTLGMLSRRLPEVL
jgi:CheY-like chemotaxis protein